MPSFLSYFVGQTDQSWFNVGERTTQGYGFQQAGNLTAHLGGGSHSTLRTPVSASQGRERQGEGSWYWLLHSDSSSTVFLSLSPRGDKRVISLCYWNPSLLSPLSTCWPSAYTSRPWDSSLSRTKLSTIAFFPPLEGWCGFPICPYLHNQIVFSITGYSYEQTLVQTRW